MMCAPQKDTHDYAMKSSGQERQIGMSAQERHPPDKHRGV